MTLVRPLAVPILLFMALVGATDKARAQIDFGPDKPKHLAAGFVIGGTGGYAADRLFDGRRGWTWAGALGSSLAAGLAKEVWDQSRYGVWDGQDVLFTVAGGAVSGLLLDVLLKKSRRRARPCRCHALNTMPKENRERPHAFRVNGEASRDLTAFFNAHRIGLARKGIP